MRKLYKATAETIAYFVADEDTDNLDRIAQESIEKEMNNAILPPCDWEEITDERQVEDDVIDTLPWGLPKDEELTIHEFLEAQAEAQEEADKEAERQKAQLPLVEEEE